MPSKDSKRFSLARPLREWVRRRNRSRSPAPASCSANITTSSSSKPHLASGANSTLTLASAATALNNSRPGTPLATAAPTKTNVPVAATPTSVVPQPPVDTVPQALLRNALDLLSSKDQAVINACTGKGPADDVSAVLEQAFQAAKAKRSACDDNRWSLSVRGHNIVLKDLAENVIVWLDRFKAVGDVAVNVDPVHAGLPWAAVRFLLEIATTARNEMASLLQGTETVLYIMNRLKAYLEYLQKVPNGVQRSNFQAALESMYALVLRFLASAIRIYQEGGISRTLRAVWRVDEIVNFSKESESTASRVEVEAQNCDRVLSGERTKDFNRMIEELEGIKKLDISISAISVNISRMWNVMERDEQAKILRWTCDIAYETNHDTAGKGRTADTGQWIFADKRFEEWECSDRSMILWIHGIPGAGKTKLLWNIVEYSKSRQNSDGLAYFYCNRTEEARRDPENVVRSFVRQLSISRDAPATHSLLVDIYQGKQARGFASSSLSVTESESLLLDLIRSYDRTVLVLDALDECDEGSRHILIEIFNRLTRKTDNLKILISSRENGDIKHQLQKEANVGIGATENQLDIEAFARAKIEENQTRRRKPLSLQIKDEIATVIHEKSQGMFQWAALQIVQLLTLDREADIRACLGDLPKDLKSAYDTIYEAICNQEGSWPVIADRTFQWITSSFMPMLASELVAAVCQDDNQDEPNEVDIDIDDVLGACRNLVVIDSENYVRFAHLSVLEYFEKNHPSLYAKGCLTISKTSLILLNYRPWWRQELLFSSRVQPNIPSAVTPLLDLLHLYWPMWIDRAQKTPWDDRMRALVHKFFGMLQSSSESYRNNIPLVARRISRSHHPPFMYDFATGHLSRGFVNYHSPFLEPYELPALAICFFGLHEVLKELCRTQRLDLKQCNLHGYSLLQLAVESGNTTMISALLDYGFEINSQVRADSSNALCHALMHGDDEATLRFLLDRNANVNAKLDGDFGNALALAVAVIEIEDVELGRETMGAVKLLLQHGADVNMQFGGQFGTALATAVVAAAASPREYTAVVRLLIDYGADVNAQPSGQFGSVLAMAAAVSAASGAGNTASIKVLLDCGANLNLQLAGAYGSALAAAAATAAASEASGGIGIVRLLLEHGADVDLPLGEEYGSVLARTAAAAAGGPPRNIAIVRLLLEHGAKVNMQLGGQFGSALAAAAAAASRTGSTAAVRLLLKHGAAWNMPLSGKFGSALAAAAATAAASLGSYTSAVRLLLRYGAEVNMQLSGEYGSALAAACAAAAAVVPIKHTQSGTDVILVLLEHGAEINMPLNTQYGSAINAAVMELMKTISFEEENGSKEDKKKQDLNDHEEDAEDVEEVEKKGKDIRVTDGDPTKLLVDYQGIKVIELLLKRGAKIDLKAIEQYTSSPKEVERISEIIQFVRDHETASSDAPRG